MSRKIGNDGSQAAVLRQQCVGSFANLLDTFKRAFSTICYSSSIVAA